MSSPGVGAAQRPAARGCAQHHRPFHDAHGLLCWLVLSIHREAQARLALVLASAGTALLISLFTPPLWTTWRPRWLVWPLDPTSTCPQSGDAAGLAFPNLSLDCFRLRRAGGRIHLAKPVGAQARIPNLLLGWRGRLGLLLEPRAGSISNRISFTPSTTTGTPARTSF